MQAWDGEAGALYCGHWYKQLTENENLQPDSLPHAAESSLLLTFLDCKLSSLHKGNLKNSFKWQPLSLLFL